MVNTHIIIADSRKMVELGDLTIDLAITSPPYWHLKDYGVEGQIGYGQTLHEYLKNLYLVWEETYRVLKPGSRLCVNVGDQFLRAIIYGRYKIAPLHSEIIMQCEKIGFDYMGSIIWQKKTTMNTTGGASVMGSYPYPPNGLVEIDYEFIMIFKKPGSRSVSYDIKEKSKLSKEEWKEYFSGHWNFAGERQTDHEAMFPDELPTRLIKMFSFVGDTILDPFLGSGTTCRSALKLGRNCVGYEINENFLRIIKEKIGTGNNLFDYKIDILVDRRNEAIQIAEPDYEPNIKDAKPVISPDKLRFQDERLYRVRNILDENTIELDTGLKVKFLGINVKEDKIEQELSYLRDYVKGKLVTLDFEVDSSPSNDTVSAYVFLKNRIFVNRELIKGGFADPAYYNFKYKGSFNNLQEG